MHIQSQHLRHTFACIPALTSMTTQQSLLDAFPPPSQPWCTVSTSTSLPSCPLPVLHCPSLLTLSPTSSTIVSSHHVCLPNFTLVSFMSYSYFIFSQMRHICFNKESQKGSVSGTTSERQDRYSFVSSNWTTILGTCGHFVFHATLNCKDVPQIPNNN